MQCLRASTPHIWEPSIYQDMCSCTYLGVDADDRHTLGGATGALGGDALELRIAVGMGGVGELLAVDAQGKAGPPEQAGDGASADLESLPTERDSQLAGGTARPLGTPAGVARRLAFEQPRQRRDERRLFFPATCGPRPACGQARAGASRTAARAVRAAPCRDRGAAAVPRGGPHRVRAAETPGRLQPPQSAADEQCPRRVGWSGRRADSAPSRS